MRIAKWLGICALALQCGAVQAFDWTSNQIELLHGSQFHEPFNPQPVGKRTVTFQHADGHAYGRNFLFVDWLQSNAADQGATEFYGEGYASLSLSKVSGHDLSGGLLRDVNLTGGVNYGSKRYPGFTVSPRVLLLGPTVDLNLPGFSFFNVDVLAYADQGLFAGASNGCHATTWQVTPAWELPFELGAAKLAFEGFVDVIGQHGNCAQQTLAQPRLRWDVGNQFGQAGHWYLGLEYQYWQNKFGVSGQHERTPQLFLMWKM